MKKLWSMLAVFAVLVNGAHAQQGSALPQLAVVEFSTNLSTEKVRADAITVRNLTESRMVASGMYQVIAREEIDKLLENQRIQVSSISSAENVRKLQLQNISYIVTGSVDAMGSDYAVTIKILDVSTGQFSHSDTDFMGGSSRELFNGADTLVARFMSGMAADGGQVTRARSGSSAVAERLPNDGPVPAGLGYEIVDGKSVTITAYAGSATSVAIPVRIQGLPVTAIGEEAFRDCSSLTSISIPASVTAIGDRAFAYCSSLTSISIPASVTAIGNSAFWGCSSLTSISIPASVTTIGDWAFYDCSSLSSVTLSRRTRVGSHVFPTMARLNYRD